MDRNRWTTRMMAMAAVAGAVILATAGAEAAVLRVTPGGIGRYYASIQDAVDAAAPGDVIQVAEGTYVETVEISTSLTLQGGWNGDFTARAWNLFRTTVDADGAGPVFRVYAGPVVTIDGFEITGGDSTTPLGWGGGIWIGESFNNEGETTVRHCDIHDNVASNDASGQGHGGGILVYNNRAVIEYNRIYHNVAQRGVGAGGEGGGVHFGWSATGIVRENEITTNTAALSAAGGWSGKGGGIYTYAGDIRVEVNTIAGNIGAVDGPAYGGGAHATGSWYDNVIQHNTASVNGEGQGGGVYANWVGRFHYNVVENNVASERGDGTGGGVYANQLQEAMSNVFAFNTATRGGGLYLGSYSRTTLSRNRIANNFATGAEPSTYDGGAGIASIDDSAAILDNEIVDNGPARAGGGIYLSGGTSVVVRGNRITGNQGFGGGGIAVEGVEGKIDRNEIASNAAWVGGGVLLQGAASPTFDGNVIVANEALGGSGLTSLVAPAVTVSLVNTIVAQNTATSTGAAGGCSIADGIIRIVNCTFVDNSWGNGKVGVAVNSTAGTHRITNTIISGHATGVVVGTGATVVSDYNDYYQNTTANISGGALGVHDRMDDPQFLNRAEGDYHLALGSPMIDHAMPTNAPATDFEGDARPRGAGIDIGADESYLVRAYVSDDRGNDTTGDGSTRYPYASITKALQETQADGSILVEQGLYLERLTIAKSVNLRGGYAYPDTPGPIWLRDIDQYETVMDGQQGGTVVTIQGEGVEALVEGFTITGGEALPYYTGGGILVINQAAATIRANRITGNHAANNGAGLVIYNDSGKECVVDGNRILGNTADGEFPGPPNSVSKESDRSPALAQGPAPGGGAYLSGGPALIQNNFIYNNSNPQGGDGLVVSAWEFAALRVLNNTVVDNGGGNGEGIAVIAGENAVFSLRNNFVVGHGVGIRTTDGSRVDADYNGFFENTTNEIGVGRRAHDVSGDPAFIDRDAGDFHIFARSSGFDTGDSTPDQYASTDIDGDTRPKHGAPDIGADELDNVPPELTFVEPGAGFNLANSSYLLQWNDSDPDDNATIAFYRDSDNTGFDGTLIVDGIEEDDAGNQAPWDTTALAEGRYWVYANISDGVNPPVSVYAPQPVKVTHVTEQEMVNYMLGRTTTGFETRVPYIDLDEDGQVTPGDLVLLLQLP